MKKLVIGGTIALLAAAIGFVLFAYPVDDKAFQARGWGADPDAALKAAATAGRPVFVKLGKHG